MKQIHRTLGIAVVAAMFAFAGVAYAKPCCDRAVAKAKRGMACVECVQNACCKDAIAKLGDQAKACKVCAKKKAAEKKAAAKSCEKK